MTELAIFPARMDFASIPLQLSRTIPSHCHLLLAAMTKAVLDSVIQLEPPARFRTAFDKIDCMVAAARSDFAAVVGMRVIDRKPRPGET